MVREVVALVSADDLVAAVRVHADRIHDLLRRNGVAESQTLSTAYRHAADLVAAVAEAPAEVVDLAGWWFGRCLAGFTADPFTTVTEIAAPGSVRSVLAGTEAEQRVRAAIATLPRHEREAVMLRDAYDLPLQAVAVAVDRSPTGAAELVASGRLRLMSQYDGQPRPDPGGHVGRQPLDPVALSAVADGSADPAVVLTTRRHVTACSVCEELSERLGRARRLALGLPVLAMGDSDREALLEAIRERADAALPSHDEVLAAAAVDTAEHRLPVLVIVGSLLIAGVLGAGIGILSKHGQTASAPLASGQYGSLPLSAPVTSPPVSASGTGLATSPPATGTRRTLPPIIIRTSRPAPTSPSAPASGSPTTTGNPSGSTPAAPALALDPRSGPSNTVITVTGAGFAPDSAVSVSYAGSQQQTPVTDGSGNFTTTVTANAAIPGRYEVTASDGVQTRSAAFQQTV